MNVLQNHSQRIKNILHGVQGLAIFIGWAITIGVFTQEGTSGGASKYYFALCWLSVPPLIYLTATPTFPRLKRFANPFVFAVLDALFTILWLAAFAAVAAWTNQGISKGNDGKKDDKEKDNDKKKDDGKKKGCDNFGYGSPAKCKLSQAAVGVGVIVCLLFVLTTALSAYTVLYFRRNGTLPSGTSGAGTSGGSHVPIDEQTKYAFSSNPHDDFDADEELAGGGRHDNHHNGHDDEEDDYEVLHPQPEDDELRHGGFGAHGGAYDSTNSSNPQYGGEAAGGGFGGDTSYHGASPASQQHQGHADPFRNPSPNPSYQSGQHGAGGDPFRDDLDHGGFASGGRLDFPDHNDYR